MTSYNFSCPECGKDFGVIEWGGVGEGCLECSICSWEGTFKEADREKLTSNPKLKNTSTNQILHELRRRLDD